MLRICKLLETAGRIKSYGRHETSDESEDCLDALFQQLEPVAPLSAEIRRCILEEDEISDDASPALKHIRRSMGQINDKVHADVYKRQVQPQKHTYISAPKPRDP